MSSRSFLALILALASGGTAAVGVSAYVKNQASMAPKEMVKVVVAAVDIPRGTLAKADQVKFRDIPRDLVHPRSITKLEDVVNRAVITPLLKDEAVLDGKLAPKGAHAGMSSVTKPGMRAFTIQTASLAAGVAGFVMPGDHVDVLLTMSGDHDGGSTTTLLQNIEVMAVDQRIEAPPENKVDLNQLRSVTLHVTPEQSLLLNLAQSKGMLHLSLRNPEDIRDAKTRPAIAADLSRQVAPAKIVEAPRAKAVNGRKFVYVYRATTQRVEKHPTSEMLRLTDGTPASIEASESMEDAPPGVSKALEAAPRVDIPTIRGFQEGAVSIGPADQAGR